MRSFILHFGMHKTGSSSIQQSLHRHLRSEAFYYIDLGSANASVPLATAFMKNPARYHVHKRRGSTADDFARTRNEIISRLGAEIEAADGRTAILSGEDILTLSKQELRDLLSALGGAQATVKLVGYVRSPKAFMESAFQQRVKGGAARLIFDNLYPGYRNRFEKLGSVFGEGNVCFWHFDPRQFPGGCVVQDFCQRLSIAFSSGDVIRTNEGLSLPALSLLFAYRKFGPGYGVGAGSIGDNRRLVRQVAQMAGPKLRFHSEVVAPIIEANRGDIRWMEERLGRSLADEFTFGDENAIHGEKELLKFAPTTLQWLAAQLGSEYEKRWRPNMSPGEVAEWMHVLRLTLSEASPKGGGQRRCGAGTGHVPVRR